MGAGWSGLVGWLVVLKVAWLIHKIGGWLVVVEVEGGFGGSRLEGGFGG